MIPLPRHWSVRHDGDSILLFPPRVSAGFIRYTERQRPVAALPDLVDRQLDGAEILEARAPDLFATSEGEYAARVSLTSRRGGALASREIGFVFVDDYVAIVDAIIHEDEHRDKFSAVVDWLVRADQHGLAHRRRPFLYSSPAGWTSRRRPHQTVWSPAGGDESMALTVFDAVPRSSTEALAAAMFSQDAAAGYVLLECTHELPVSNAHELSGTTVAITGSFPGLPVTHRPITVLEDSNFVYLIRLDSVGAIDARRDGEAVLASVVDSVEPIPVPAASLGDTFAHWAA